MKTVDEQTKNSMLMMQSYLDEFAADYELNYDDKPTTESCVAYLQGFMAGLNYEKNKKGVL